MKKYIKFCDCCKTNLLEESKASNIIINVDDNLNLECSCLDLCNTCKDKIEIGMKKIQVIKFKSAWPIKVETIPL